MKKTQVEFVGLSDMSRVLGTLQSRRTLTQAEFAAKLVERGDCFMREDETTTVKVKREGGFGAVIDLEAAGLTEPDERQLRKLVEARGMPWDPGFVGRSQVWWASDERVDSYGDIVRQRWDFGTFEKNSPMPWSHAWGGPPIGRHLNWKTLRRDDPDYKGPAMQVLGLFATRAQSEFSDEIMRLVKGGFMPSCSVGFRCRNPIHVEDKDEREKLGLGKWGLVLDDNELLEVSPVTLPANSGANAVSGLIKARGEAGLITAFDLQVLREMTRRRSAMWQVDDKATRRTEDVEAWHKWEEQVVEIARTVFPKAEFEKASDIDAPIVDDATAAEERERLESRSTQVQVVKVEPIVVNDEASADVKAIATVVNAQTELINDLAKFVTSAFADIQRTLDTVERVLEQLGAGSSEETDETEDEDDDEDDSLSSLRGDLSKAVTNLTALCGASQ